MTDHRRVESPDLEPLWPGGDSRNSSIEILPLEDEHLQSRTSRTHRKHKNSRRILMLAFIGSAFIIAFLSLSYILSDWSYYASHMEHKADDHGHGNSPESNESHNHQDNPHDDQNGQVHAVEKPSAADLAKDFILDPGWDFNAAPQVREFDWTLEDSKHNPDGVYRDMILVNKQYPGPMIESNQGDIIRVKVTNNARNASSIHWHGLYQNGTNHMDGTVGVTQCPITPGNTFTYEFKTDSQSGTYWWHAHQALQSADGVHGPLIIHARDERDKLQKIKYGSDRVIMVSDYYHDPSPGLLMKYLASDRENIEPVPDGAVINGHSKRDCSKLPQRECNTAFQHVGFPRIDLKDGESHRFRLINVGTFAEFQITLDEHDFAVTEVDGTDVEPQRFDRLSILPAQRYSIVVEAKKEPKNFYLRAKMLVACFQEKNPDLESDTVAIINSITSDTDLSKGIQTPTSKDWDLQVDVECRDMNTTSLVPVIPVNAPVAADESFYLRSNFEIGAYRLSRGFFNTSSFRPNLNQPSLLRAFDGIAHGNKSYAVPAEKAAWVNGAAFQTNQELVIQTDGIKTIDLLISNFDDGSHPFHLHGYKFFVLAQGHGYPPDNLTSTVNVDNPLRRDTATVEHFGWALIRIIADNPGLWAFHCHVGWHAEAGLLMQLMTRSDEIGKLEIPASHRALCSEPLNELEKGAVPPDKVFMID